MIGHRAEARNALDKARTLRAVIDDFVAALEAAHDESEVARRR